MWHLYHSEAEKVHPGIEIFPSLKQNLYLHPDLLEFIFINIYIYIYILSFFFFLQDYKELAMTTAIIIIIYYQIL